MMKQNTAVKFAEWHQPEAINTQATMLDAKIGWRKISDDKGRGVFALRNIKKSEVVEICPVVVVAKTNFKSNGHAPDGYLFDWDPETKGQEHCMPLGYAMMYNHGKNPNIAMECDMENFTITAVASRDIKSGEELTWNYNCELWFDEE